MILSSIFIDNFRNLKNVFIELTDFEVLIGENNMEKLIY
jgi:predicted ATPase